MCQTESRSYITVPTSTKVHHLSPSFLLLFSPTAPLYIAVMSPATLHTTPVPAVSSADKSKPIFPLMIANGGFSEVGEEKEASATCFCGNVQLSFVSEWRLISVKSYVLVDARLMPGFCFFLYTHCFPAYGRTWLPQCLCVSLHRLPNCDGFDVCNQLHRRLFSHQVHPWQI